MRLVWSDEALCPTQLLCDIGGEKLTVVTWEHDIAGDVDDWIVSCSSIRTRNWVLARDLAQMLAPLGKLPVVRDTLKSAPGENGTSGLWDAKVFLGKVISEFGVAPVITHELDEGCNGEGSFFAPGEKRGEGVDWTVSCDESRGCETLSNVDRHKGELLRSCKGCIRGPVECDSGKEFLSESEVEDWPYDAYRSRRYTANGAEL
jgi:hypothetical protein